MNIAGLSSYVSVSQSDEGSHKRSCAGTGLDAGCGNRNTGPDTVSFSSEAMEKCLALKNSSSDTDANNEEECHPSGNDFLSRQSGRKKNQKMSSAELLAFLTSDSFAEQAMRYAKDVTIANAANSSDEEEKEDETLDELMSARKKNGSLSTKEATAESGKTTGAENEQFIHEKSMYKDQVNERIHKLEAEIKELTAAYETIMSGEGELEEKVRLSQPVHNRLEERLRELQALKVQAQSLTQEV